MLKAKIRRGTTVTVVVSFLVLALSGLIMYFYPHSGPPAAGGAGVTAQAAGISFRYLLKVVHEQISLLFVAASAFHIVFNWNGLVLSFVKRKG